MKNFYILLILIFIINNNIFASSSPNEELKNADFFAGASDKASAKIFNESCVSCHSGGVPRAPHSTTFSAMSADYILETLDGVMSSQASHLSKDQKIKPSVCIPIYKSELNKFEIISIKSHIFKLKSHDIFLLVPNMPFLNQPEKLFS